VTARATERRRDDWVRLAHRGLDVAGYFFEAGRLLADVAPYDGCCWFTLDPATFLPTCHITENSIRDEDVPALARNEYEEEDVNKFSELARHRAAGILSVATGGQRERSNRYSGILRPNGFEDELRAAFVEEGAAWGGAALYRHPDSPDFEESEAGSVASVGPYIAEGLRRAILISSVTNEPTPEAPGLILLDEDGGVDAMTPAAEGWLRDLAASPAQGVGSRGHGFVPPPDAGSCSTAPCSRRTGPRSSSNRRARPRSRR
jgi:hypothetical protein